MKRVLKVFSAVLLVLAIVLCMAGCGGEKQEDAMTIRIAALKGPTALGMLKMMAEPEGTDTYEFTLAGSPDELVGRIVQGDFDMAAVPTNLAATLFNRTEGKVQIAALNTLGVLYCVEIGDTVNSIADLKGKTVYNLGKGSTPEFALNYLLKENGIDPENDLTVEYATEAGEVASLMAAGEANLAILPQPFVTSLLAQNDKVRVAFSVTEEWDKLDNGSVLSMGCLLVQKSFAQEHPGVMKRFLEEYKKSVDFTNGEDTIAKAAEYSEQFDVIPAAVAQKAIPQCNIVLISGEEMKSQTEGFLEVLYNADPSSVGGALPTDDFYYIGDES